VLIASGMAPSSQVRSPGSLAGPPGPGCGRTLKPMSDGPLLVYGPASPTYDFGPAHPLTPRRFGPGIDLLRSLGAIPGLAPVPAADSELRWVHSARYIDVVRRLSIDPFGPPEAGLGQGGDDPPFPGMHEAAAAVAGGSIAAVDAILAGAVEHAFHPGGGLHHALPARASGFCIYNDPALAIARARQAGRRVLYLDFDVHHGDGVQAIHATDPGVMTVSFHESGRHLFPGTGRVDELGEGGAAGTIVNVPFEPPAGDVAWLAAVRTLVPLLAAAFGPDLIVSQHGADSHAWDPLAHLRVTTTAMAAAARLTDDAAHRHAGGAWLATGGGGYDAYRVVPRSWSLVWLAGAHRDPPPMTPIEWRDRWAGEAARYGRSPLPERYLDAPNAGLEFDADQARADARSLETAALVRILTVPLLLRAAVDAGWWAPGDDSPATTADRAGSVSASGTPTVSGPLDGAHLERLTLAARVIAPADPRAGLRLLVSAARSGALVVGALDGSELVGVAVALPAAAPSRPGGPAAPARGFESTDLAPAGDVDLRPPHRLLAVGVAPAHRGRGVGRSLLATLTELLEGPIVAEAGAAERDAIEPLPYPTRMAVARSLLVGAGFTIGPLSGEIARADPAAIVGRRP